MTTTYFSAATRCVCGHTDNASFHYQSSKARQDEERYARYSLCSDCSMQLRSAWACEPAAKVAADPALPDLWGCYTKQQGRHEKNGPVAMRGALPDRRQHRAIPV